MQQSTADILYLPVLASVPVKVMTFTHEMTESGVIDKTTMVFGQMNEPPGARMRVGLDRTDNGRIFP